VPFVACPFVCVVAAVASAGRSTGFEADCEQPIDDGTAADTVREGTEGQRELVSQMLVRSYALLSSRVSVVCWLAFAELRGWRRPAGPLPHGTC
jgi:hypothetical protein